MPPSKRYITILKLSKKNYHFFITHSSLFLHYNLPLLNYSIEIKLHKLAQPLLMYTVSVQQSLWSPHSSLLCHSVYLSISLSSFYLYPAGSLSPSPSRSLCLLCYTWRLIGVPTASWIYTRLRCVPTPSICERDLALRPNARMVPIVRKLVENLGHGVAVCAIVPRFYWFRYLG